MYRPSNTVDFLALNKESTKKKKKKQKLVKWKIGNNWSIYMFDIYASHVNSEEN